MHYLKIVTTGAWSFVWVILNLPAPVELVITHVDDRVELRLISQLIKGISGVLQKLIKYFNGTINRTSSLLLLAAVIPVIFYFRFK